MDETRTTDDRVEKTHSTHSLELKNAKGSKESASGVSDADARSTKIPSKRRSVTVCNTGSALKESLGLRVNTRTVLFPWPSFLQYLVRQPFCRVQCYFYAYVFLEQS
jgi:hypothetical protein